MSILSLHPSYEDVTPSSAAAVSTLKSQIWALHETRAKHNMFDDMSLFDKSTLKSVDNSSKRLKLAVHSEGMVKPKAP